MTIPPLLQYILWAGAGILALVTIWTKAIKPLSRLIATSESMVPLLIDLTSQLKDSPNSFSVLKQIIAEFRTDSGSSLRDAVDRIDKSAKDNRVAAEVLKINVEAVSLLAAQDRANAAHLQVLMDDLKIQVTEILKTLSRTARSMDIEDRRDIKNTRQMVSGDIGGFGDIK